jgi:RNA polymerase sigma-70 factor (ECF subfamily)
MRDLHGLLVRAARHQVSRMRAMVPGWGEPRLEDLAQGAADDALVALLGKLASFQGRSRFTTWAYKFAILEAATQVRRQAWASREVAFADLSLVAAPGSGPADVVETRDLGTAVVRAMDEVLTPYQRRIAIALLVDEVPIDVLAERLATNRGALYKTLHVARGRLRATLIASGHLTPPPDTSGAGS